LRQASSFKLLAGNVPNKNVYNTHTFKSRPAILMLTKATKISDNSPHFKFIVLKRFSTMKQQVAQLIEQAITNLKNDGFVPADVSPKIMVDNTKDKAHGDLASNIAMMLAKPCKSNPRAIAEKVIAAIPENDVIAKIEIAGPGFINFFINAASAFGVINDVLANKENFGKNDSGAGKKVQVEFVSANPTGPLHIGHGRGAAVGDCICNLMAASGWDVTREFYYNDAGNQIANLGLSVQARCKGFGVDHESWPENGYQGQYIIDVAESYMGGESVEADGKVHVGAKDADNVEAITRFAVAFLRREQDLDLSTFGVNFDVYYLESSLYEEGKVEAAVQEIIKNGHTYEKEGALWFKSTDFGDDKDRVMRKSDGGYTYFVPDVAYHKNKWDRGFVRVVNEQGADHHSTVMRVRAGLQALDMGIPEGWPEYVLHQMVTVMRDGEEVKISKRAGSYVTLRDLTEEVGRDATRFFLASRATTSQLTFDIDLAMSQTNENPVYYIQYAHARIAGVTRKLAEQGLTWNQENGTANLELLSDDAQVIANKLARFPELIKSAGISAEPHLIANYLKDLAGDFHSYYNTHKMVIDDANLRDAQINLAQAIAQVIRNGLSILGVSAPERM
jgi:arginyl-tRNA synthetase